MNKKQTIDAYCNKCGHFEQYKFIIKNSKQRIYKKGAVLEDCPECEGVLIAESIINEEQK